MCSGNVEADDGVMIVSVVGVGGVGLEGTGVAMML